MNNNSAVAGSFHEIPFSYQQDTTSPCRRYVAKLKAMQFNEDFQAFSMEDFQNNYILFLT